MGREVAMDANRLGRRRFLDLALASGALVAAPVPGWLRAALAGVASGGDDLAELIERAPVARYWVGADGARADGCGACHQPGEIETAKEHRHERRPVRCELCARACRIDAGERGMCRARYNHRGQLKSLVYGRPMTIHVDPIEKKPFFHFLPGADAFSLATSGCPLRCKFCQNWEISQARPEDYRSPRIEATRLAAAAAERRAEVVAFTYNEPTVFFEYLVDIARAARERKRRSVLVSCGYMQERPLAEMCQVLDAIKIDLKGYSDDFYRRVSDASLAPVLRSIRQVARSGRHLELVNLVVPTLNDSEAMLRDLARWVVDEAGPDVPVHFTRFHPDYQLTNLPPTPVATLERAREIGLGAGLHYAYVGNVPGHPGNHTYCPGCGKAVVERDGLFVLENRLRDGKCPDCGRAIAGVWA
jgi:pyruvate formate lyase activating enzyme